MEPMRSMVHAVRSTVILAANQFNDSRPKHCQTALRDALASRTQEYEVMNPLTFFFFFKALMYLKDTTEFLSVK